MNTILSSFSGVVIKVLEDECVDYDGTVEVHRIVFNNYNTDFYTDFYLTVFSRTDNKTEMFITGEGLSIKMALEDAADNWRKDVGEEATPYDHAILELVGEMNE